MKITDRIDLLMLSAKALEESVKAYAKAKNDAHGGMGGGHGWWAWREDWGHSSISEPPELLDAYWICSACGTDLLQYLKSHFPDIPSYTECSEEVPPTLERCPSCGAKMDGGAEE